VTELFDNPDGEFLVLVNDGKMSASRWRNRRACEPTVNVLTRYGSER
jgi:hypothetical protein